MNLRVRFAARRLSRAFGGIRPFLRVPRPMENPFILTPYLLDEPLPELEALLGPDWRLNKLHVPHTERQPSRSLLHESLARMVAESVESGHRPVSIAGDCCSSIGVAAGMQRAGADCFLVWFDAHGGFQHMGNDAEWLSCWRRFSASSPTRAM